MKNKKKSKWQVKREKQASENSQFDPKIHQLGRLDEAEASYTRAITENPNYTVALHNRWHLRFTNGDFVSALKDADASKFGRSGATGLATLYALGQTEEIYKRIELYSKNNRNDLDIAAFSTFIAWAEKKATANNFCLNPLDFIHISCLSSYTNNSKLFVKNIIRELKKAETIWEPSGKTTTSGFQTLNDVNLFEKPPEALAKLKSIILQELDVYYSKYQHEPCSLIKDWPTEKKLFGWQVVLKKSGHQKAHIHAGGWVSGVIYLQVVPSKGTNEGAIEFSLNGEHYTDLRAPKFTFQPKPGDMVLFPSSLHHKTIPFNTDAERIIISFDLQPVRSAQ